MEGGGADEMFFFFFAEKVLFIFDENVKLMNYVTNQVLYYPMHPSFYL